MLKQNLSQKMLQKLSPQQIQLIKLLELPTVQLEQRIKKEIEENPVLEEGHEQEEDIKDELNNDPEEPENEYNDEFTIEDYIPDDDDIPAYKLTINNYSKDDKVFEIPLSEGFSLQEHLTEQLRLKKLNEKELQLAEYLIGSLDEAGYLRRDVESIVDDLAFSQNISVTIEEINSALKIIQDLDPVGVGAGNLQETLILQINKNFAKNKNDITIKTATNILENYFEEFSKKHYSKIEKRLGISSEDLKKAVDIILKLNPKPGSNYSSAINRAAPQITPDFILKVIDGEPVISLNSKNIPPLRVSRTYEEMLRGLKESKSKQSKSEKQAVGFMKQKLDSAKWFIDAVKQRQNTLLLTINAIVGFQKEYFIDGDETKLRPMILKDIAELTGLDISTISRVANSKYIQTHFGIFPLKFFFSEGMETQDGETVSTREIKKILQECIDNENKKRPLTDEKLAEILQEKGYRIARRTVAKYREQLGILVARLRKEL
ncbi:MAG: RNA polymerase factor sigma-54 [Chlorobi bacterium]|nr:RNA polymerase factor sigma-54 [Chlorobiota bacterium]